MTGPPRAGTMTMPRRATRRRGRPSGRSSSARTISSITVCASNWANAAPADLVRDRGVQLDHLAPEPAQAHQPVGAEERVEQGAACVGRPRDQPAQQCAEAVEARALVDAEHRAQHDPERDRVHAGQRRRGRAERPRRDLPPRRVADERVVDAHPLAVERREHELAAAQVLVPVEQQDVLRPEQRTQRPVRRSRVDLGGAVRVQLPHRLRVRQHHPRLPHRTRREDVAERAVGRLEEAVRVEPVAQRLQRERPARAGWEAGRDRHAG